MPHLTTLPACTTDFEAVPIRAAHNVFAAVDTDEPCTGCGTVDEDRDCHDDCQGTWCSSRRCQDSHFDNCAAERVYALDGGWDE